ncbi:MAG: acetylglutamate kinase [Euryarchaeota archaeon]|nr:acetylglutamate kinase [Euryarchaeota archaeon]
MAVETEKKTEARAEERKPEAPVLTREQVLIEALPYIREFHGSTVLVKVGGHVVDTPEALDHIMRDVVLLRYVGIRPVVVHGGGADISAVMTKMGMEPKFVGGLRVTDEATLDVVVMLLGKLNHKLVSLVEKHGGKGLGLSGSDSRLITARKHDPVMVRKKEVDLGWVGQVEQVSPEVILMALERGYIPVVAPIAIDEQGNTFNVNADEVAGAIAGSLRAKKLLMLTDVPGVLRDPGNPASLISRLSAEEAREMMGRRHIKGGMIPKLESALRAVEQGVPEAHIINGMRHHSILLELFTREGIGTMVHRGTPGATPPGASAKP